MCVQNHSKIVKSCLFVPPSSENKVSCESTTSSYHYKISTSEQAEHIEFTRSYSSTGGWQWKTDNKCLLNLLSQDLVHDCFSDDNV